MADILQVEDLRLSLRRDGRLLPILKGVDLRVGQGEVVGLAGESGSGKSMTMRAVLGLIPDGCEMTGSVTLGDTELTGAPRRLLSTVRGRRIGMVFQDATSSLHPMLTIETQLTEHLRRHLKVSRAAALARAKEMLDEVRIPDPASALKKFPHQFSGGMRQRIAIAIAMACEPELLIADEPTTALDVTVQAGILNLVHRLAKSQGVGVIFITHDLAVLAAMTDRCYVMYSGEVVEVGGTAALIDNPLHPYTSALIESLPSRSGNRHLVDIPGDPPELGQYEAGCLFSSRCKFATDDCRARHPELDSLPAGRSVRCMVKPFAPEGDSR